MRRRVLVGIIFALSLIAWVALFRASSPPDPPEAVETLMIVAVVAILVLGGDRLLARLRRPREKHE